MDLIPASNVFDKIIEPLNMKFGLELGVRRGEFTASLLERHPDLIMNAVDIWNSTVEGHDNDNNYNTFIQNLQDSKVNDRCRIYKMYFDEAINYIEDESLDFIFIDGTHTYNALKNDIFKWFNKVKDNGLITGHDYHPLFDGGGMIRCVDELIGLSVKLLNNGDSMEAQMGSVSSISDHILNKCKGGIVCQSSTCWFCRKQDTLLYKDKLNATSI